MLNLASQIAKHVHTVYPKNYAHAHIGQCAFNGTNIRQQSGLII